MQVTWRSTTEEEIILKKLKTFLNKLVVSNLLDLHHRAYTSLEYFGPEEQQKGEESSESDSAM